MKTPHTRTTTASILLAIASLLPAAAAAQDAPARFVPGPGEPTLAEVRQATERFRDVTSRSPKATSAIPRFCETADMMGRPPRRGRWASTISAPICSASPAPPSPRVDGNGTHTDFRKPSILIYEPQANGSMELVAVENLVFARSLARERPVRPRPFTASLTTRWSTIRRRRPTRRTCSSRISTATCGSIATTRRHVHALQPGGDVRASPGHGDAYEPLGIADWGLRIADCRLQIADCRLQIAD